MKKYFKYPCLSQFHLGKASYLKWSYVVKLANRRENFNGLSSPLHIYLMVFTFLCMVL